MRWSNILPIVLVLSLPAPAFAGDEPSAAAQETARTAGEEGLKYFSSGQWDKAYEAFRRADSAYHAPTLVLYMAHAQKQRGKLLAARALYRRVADERIPRTAPTQFLNAQLVARDELMQLEKRIPVLRLAFTGQMPSDARITVDGEDVAAVAAQSLQLDPGEHVIQLSTGHVEPVVWHVRLREESVVDLAIPLPEPDPPPPPPDDVDPHLAPSPAPVAVHHPQAASPSTPPKPIDHPARGPLTPAFVAFGLGAVGLGAGAVMGVMSLNDTSQLRSICGADMRCPASARDLAGSAGRLADASTAAFIAGGAFVATGIVLAWVRPGGSHAPRAPRVGVGPSSVVVTGAF